MPLIQNYDKKIITNAGRKSLQDLKVSQKFKAFTLIELLAILLIISCVLLASDGFVILSKTYYQHRQTLVINKIKNLVEFAKNTANVANTTVILCPSKNPVIKKDVHQICSTGWHNPIIIFYGDNKNIPYKKEKILLITQNLINNKEEIKLKNFQHKNHIKFNNNPSQQTVNGTIHYKNMYYNKDIKINRSGRIIQ